MTHRDRILSVFRNEAPDVVPFMLDLSHWLGHKLRLPFDLSRSYADPIPEMIDYHKRAETCIRFLRARSRPYGEARPGSPSVGAAGLGAGSGGACA